MGDTPSSPSLVDSVIGGRYRLTKLLGQGGMGEVYSADHVHIHKRVAVKLLHPQISQDPEALARFRQEAQSASSIGHENIIAIDDFGNTDDGRVYLCMEFLQGKSLSDAMHEGMKFDDMLTIMEQVCDGLGAAHAKGIIHRDMKPENVFLTYRNDGKIIVKILDFGIAKVSQNDKDNHLTRTGAVFGTPHYMSPEQALGQKIDARSDVYAMGVVLFELFTGELPFKGDSFMGILSQHITAPPPRPTLIAPQRAIPIEVEQVILRAMAKDPADRFQDMTTLKAALSALRNHPHAAMLGTQPSAHREAAVAPTVAAPAKPTNGATNNSQPQVPKTVISASSPYSASRSALSPSGSDNAKSSSPDIAGWTPDPSTKTRSSTNAIVIVLIVIGIVGGATALTLSLTGKDNGEDDKSAPSKSTARTTKKAEPTQAPATTTVSSEKSDNANKPPASAAGPKSEATEKTQQVAASAATTAQPTPPSGATAIKVGATESIKTTAPQPSTQPQNTGHTPPPTDKSGEKTAPATTANTTEKPTHDKREEPTGPRRVTLVTVPSDAAVFRDGKRIGRTPHQFELEPDESIRVMIARGGYKDQWVTVTADSETVRVKMKHNFVGGQDNDGEGIE